MLTAILVGFFIFILLIVLLLKLCGFLFFSDMGRWVRMTIRWGIIIASFFQFGVAAGILAFLLCNKYAVMGLIAFIYGFKQG